MSRPSLDGSRNAGARAPTSSAPARFVAGAAFVVVAFVVFGLDAAAFFFVAGSFAAFAVDAALVVAFFAGAFFAVAIPCLRRASLRTRRGLGASPERMNALAHVFSPKVLWVP